MDEKRSPHSIHQIFTAICFLLFFAISGSFLYCFSVEDPKPGTLKTIRIDSDTELRFRWCPRGTFQMGSPLDEKDRDAEEIPHRVTFTAGFWILETEITQKIYQAIMNDNPSQFRGASHPVDSVSWEEANRFVQKIKDRLSKTSEGEFALPTEAQWEYACRAGSAAPWSGDLKDIAWFGENRDTGSTHPVGTKNANAWGIFDMHGNLWEWTADYYYDYKPDPVINPRGPIRSDSGVRIDRGGCWDSTPDYCRSAHRGVYEPDRKSPFVGFRIVLNPLPHKL
ncbi:MAG: formylglycine-generating enzyme family protein [Planctomycetia bacterium]|nr:formylglycine-generating enzyme family protein [Planctomycetia bacterium]